jgi:hypothetical protein
MIPWLLLLVTIVVGYIAFDAYSLRGNYKKVPYSIIAKELGQDVSNLPIESQERLRNWNLRWGLGNMDQAPFAFLLLFLLSLFGTIVAFLQ